MFLIYIRERGGKATFISHVVMEGCFYEDFKKFHLTLNTEYTSRGLLHGNITLESLHRGGSIDRCGNNNIVPIPYRHPDILLTGVVTLPTHDHWSLFIACVCSCTGGGLFNSADSPIKFSKELWHKVECFMKIDWPLLSRGNSDDIIRKKDAILYTYKVVRGEILI